MNNKWLPTLMKFFPRKLLRQAFIPFSVSLDPKLMFVKKETDLRNQFPFNQQNLHYLYSGTAAIYQAVKDQGWGHDDEIICPAFNCGHELEPILRAGVSVSCYRVGKDLQIDLEHLEKTITDRTRAVLIIHYFGFPQAIHEIQEICQNKGVLLIEDCAHGLFSRYGKYAMGSIGDWSIFSFRKTLPLPEGGGLLINNPALDKPLDLSQPAKISYWTKTLSLIKKYFFNNAVKKGSLFYKLLSLGLLPLISVLQFVGERNVSGAAVYYDPDDERLDFDTGILSWAMSKNSYNIINNINPEPIIGKRHANFLKLADLIGDLKHCRSVFTRLPEGVCPLYYPVLVYNREEIVAELHDLNIFVAPWWEYFHPGVAWDDFADAVFLKDHMIALPVHQDIDILQIEKMAEVLRQYGL
jgi:dTDP-4-amino-4,6-dideoxygalactose transaminase